MRKHVEEKAREEGALMVRRAIERVTHVELAALVRGFLGSCGG